MLGHTLCIPRHMYSSLRLLLSWIRGIPKFLGSDSFHLGLERLHVNRRSKQETIIQFLLQLVRHWLRPFSLLLCLLSDYSLSVSFFAHDAGYHWSLPARLCVLVQATWNEPSQSGL